jgi:hypothetical protein
LEQQCLAFNGGVDCQYCLGDAQYVESGGFVPNACKPKNETCYVVPVPTPVPLRNQPLPATATGLTAPLTDTGVVSSSTQKASASTQRASPFAFSVLALLAACQFILA